MLGTGLVNYRLVLGVHTSANRAKKNGENKELVPSKPKKPNEVNIFWQPFRIGSKEVRIETKAILPSQIPLLFFLDYKHFKQLPARQCQ